MEVHLGGHGGRQRLRGAKRAGRSIGRLLRSVGGRVAAGGLGLRGAPRPGRPALSAQASAGRPARRPRRCTCSGRRCTRLRSPSACRARTGRRRCPRCHSVPPVALPVGAVLGVALRPVGVRDHGEPAGVAVPALPSVGVAILVSEHAAAEDADAMEGVPISYDRRHAMLVSLFFGSCEQTNRLMGQPAVVVWFESRERECGAHRRCFEAYQNSISGTPSGRWSSHQLFKMPVCSLLLL